jgi:hypothetical protein
MMSWFLDGLVANELLVVDGYQNSLKRLMDSLRGCISSRSDRQTVDRARPNSTIARINHPEQVG